MSSTGDKKTRLFRIRKTIGKMLNARGYMVGQAELDLGKDQFVEEHGEDPARANLTMQFPRRDDPADSIFVFFPDEEKVGAKFPFPVCLPPRLQDKGEPPLNRHY